MTTPREELEALLEAAERVINWLMDDLAAIENGEHYQTFSHSENIKDADDWLKWKNGEGTDEELLAIKKTL